MLDEFAARMRDSYTPRESDPWWYDNSGHLAAGLISGTVTNDLIGLGLILSGVVYLALAAIWEAFEYHYNIRPWDPREYSDWGFDRAIEDTLLDTYIGITGVAIAVVIL